MIVYKCKMCGGNLEIQEGMSVCECEYCGSMQTVPNADDEKKMTLFTRANRLRAECEFDKAYGIYESIVSEFQEEAEAYWGLVLCKYGIEYVDDPKTGKKIPTCHRSSFDNVLEDSNYEMVIECSDAIARPVYRAEAQAIEDLRAGIIKVSAKEEPYDIFICYKETDVNGERTVDSVLAQDVYDALTDKGYKVFFSRISLEDKLGVEYEPYIFAALNSAKIMLAFGTNYEHYNAVWVKNEWSRFLSMVEKGEKKILIPCYKGIDAYDMPAEFKRLQGQDLGKVGAIQDLIRGIDKIFERKTVVETKIVSMENATSPNNALVKRGFLYLEDKDYDKADEYFEKALDENPENGEAYLGKVFSKLRIQNLEELQELPVPSTLFPDFEKAVRFLDNEQKNRLNSILEENKSQDKNGERLIKRIQEGTIADLILLAPRLQQVVNLSNGVIGKNFGAEKSVIDEILAKYEVYSVFEKSSEPMNIEDLRNASKIIEKLEDTTLRNILVYLNHAGVISLNKRKFSFLSDSFKKSKNDEGKGKLEGEISSIEERIEKLRQRVTDLPLEIEEVKNRLAGSDELCEEAERKAEQERQNILADIESVNGRKEELLNQIKSLESELLSLTGFSKITKGAKLKFQIRSIEDSVKAVDNEIKSKSDKLTDIKGAERVIEEMENSIGMMEDELKNSLALIDEFERKRDVLKAERDSYEWKPEQIDIDFKASEYDFVMPIDDVSYENSGTVHVVGRISEGAVKCDDLVEIVHSDGSSQKYLKVYTINTRGDKVELELLLQGIIQPISKGDLVVLKGHDEDSEGYEKDSIEDYILKNFAPTDKMKAIQYYREKTGTGLAEAKNAVDSIFN